MIRFGLRLAVAGGREAITRLAVIAAAVALGVGLLLATLAGVNAVNAQNQRYAWLNTGSASVQAASATADSSTDPLWWLIRRDYFDNQLIARVDVAASGPDSPSPSGMPRLPGPGQFYASPALTTLLSSTPADELADRFPGHQIGTIDEAALPSPDPSSSSSATLPTSCRTSRAPRRSPTSEPARPANALTALTASAPRECS